jgi:hypothetical protein
MKEMLLAAGAVATAGCGFLPAPAEPSPEIVFVQLNREQFALQQDDPLENTVKGTIIDSLGSLNGCWGTHVPSDSAVERVPVIFEVFKFEASTGDFEWHSYEDWPAFLLDGFIVFSGEFSVASDRELETVDRILSFYSYATGEQVTTTLPEDTPPVRMSVTLAGDRLKIFFRDADDPGNVPPALVFRQFACP